MNLRSRTVLTFTIDQIALSAKGLNIQPHDSYIGSYREFLKYFEDLNEITFHNFVIGTHFIYGWMPTILELRGTEQRMAEVVSIMNVAKQGRLVTENELSILQEVINNSPVGPSKLLHFVRPDIYAIWDGKIYQYINGVESDYQMGKPKNYLAYLANCGEVTSDRRFERIHDLVNAKVGYKVSAFRAVELVMFYSSR